MAHMRNPDQEIQQHIDALYSEKEHMSKEIYLLRETIKELELRIETQKQTLASRDESIKKLMEAMQSKGISGKMMEEERMEMERIRTRNIELETRLRHVESIADSRERDSLKVEELRIEVSRKEQEIMAMGAKMKTLEEQHHDYQRHISVLKESLLAKEEHNNMLHNDVRTNATATNLPTSYYYSDIFSLFDQQHIFQIFYDFPLSPTSSRMHRICNIVTLYVSCLPLYCSSRLKS